MRILYIVPYTPNQIRVRPYNLIRTLARRGHQMTLATLWENEQEQVDLERLRSEGITVVAHPLSKAQAGWNSLLALPTRVPMQARYCWQPVLADDLVKLAHNERFDVIHVEHLRGAAFGLHLMHSFAKREFPRPPLVWDSVDCISHLFAQAASHSRSLKSRLMTRLELPRTRRYEGWLAQQFDHVLVTSPVDKAALDGLRKPATSPLPPISVIPNGVDTDYFAPAVELPDPHAPPTVVVSGKMSYHANVTMALHLAQEIMPLVWRERPDVRLMIVGKDPPAMLRDLDPHWSAGSPQPRLHDHLQRIIVTGEVPDLRLYLQNATMGSAPVVYGAGIQNKVLEAMACGLPIVVSSTANSGLKARNGVDLVVADSAQAHARAILELLAQPARRLAMGEQARRFVQENHSWSAVVGDLEKIY